MFEEISVGTVWVVRMRWDGATVGIYTTKSGAEKFVNKVSAGRPEEYLIEESFLCE